jgi:outer membrane receptor protein involved in Fe transport
MTVATGQPTPTSRTLPDRDDTVFNLRVAALYHVTDTVTAWGSFGAGFRAPTLNELPSSGSAPS